MAYRRSYRRVGRPRSYRRTAVRRQLSSYMNPFTTATDVKIPDGKSLLSKGIKHNQSFSLGLEGDTCTIVMFPGLSNGFHVLNGQINGSPTPATMVYDNAPVRDFTSNAWLNEQINKWRLVSQGLKINMVNNMDDNDGWFEAARCNVSFDDNADFNYTSVEGNALLTPGPTFPYISPTENMANSPSYMTGTLKAIGRFKFHLMPTSREHEFHRICTAGTSSGADTKDEGDESFDCIVIRLHGKAGVTQLHVQHVANHEYEFHHTSSLHHTQTYSKAAPGAVSRVNSMKKVFGRRAGSMAKNYLKGTNYGLAYRGVRAFGRWDRRRRDYIRRNNTWSRLRRMF